MKIPDFIVNFFNLFKKYGGHQPKHLPAGNSESKLLQTRFVDRLREGVGPQKPMDILRDYQKLIDEYNMARGQSQQFESKNFSNEGVITVSYLNAKQKQKGGEELSDGEKKEIERVDKLIELDNGEAMFAGAILGMQQVVYARKSDRMYDEISYRMDMLMYYVKYLKYITTVNQKSPYSFENMVGNNKDVLTEKAKEEINADIFWKMYVAYLRTVERYTRYTANGGKVPDIKRFAFDDEYSLNSLCPLSGNECEKFEKRIRELSNSSGIDIKKLDLKKLGLDRYDYYIFGVR